MPDLFLDLETDDILVDPQGKMRLTRTVEEEVRQLLRTRLRRFLGEWFLDTRLGVAYFRDVLVHAPNLSVIRALFSKEISETPGVANLKELRMVWDTPDRTLDVEFSVVLDTGEILELSLGISPTSLGSTVLTYNGVPGAFP
jgi:hypothetical protein